MKPECSVVVPDVVIGIVREDADRQTFLAHKAHIFLRIRALETFVRQQKAIAHRGAALAALKAPWRLPPGCRVQRSAEPL